KSQIDYEPALGQKITLMNDAPLVQVGKGVDPQTRNAGNGCFFQAFNISSPLFRFNGGGIVQDYDQLELQFTILHSESLNLSSVAAFTNLFSLFNAAFSFTDIAGTRVAAYQAAATE